MAALLSGTAQRFKRLCDCFQNGITENLKCMSSAMFLCHGGFATNMPPACGSV